MRIVLGPYDLTSPSAAASVALMLGSSDGGVITLAPSPLEGDAPEGMRTADSDAPRYLRLLEAWRWTGPLWRAGLLAADQEGASPLEDIRAVVHRIGADPQTAALRALGGAGLFSDPQQYLETLSRDLLRGGGDPAVSIPLAAGMERFAARHGLPLVRLANSSLASRIDKRSGLAIARFSIPAIVGPAAVGFLELHRRLTPPLDDLRAALQTLFAQPPGEPGGHNDRLAASCREFAAAFTRTAREILEVSAREGEAARIAELAVTVSLAPVGAGLEAAHQAAGLLAPVVSAERRSETSTAPRESGASTALNLPRLVVLTARPAPWDLPRPK